MGRLSWIIQVGPNAILMQGTQKEGMFTHREKAM